MGQPLLLTERERRLSGILRFGEIRTMLYRTDVGLHAERVRLIIRDISDVVSAAYLGAFDLRYAENLAIVHDDPEMITGDISSARKRKMNTMDSLALERDEMNAILRLYSLKPEGMDEGYYRELLFHAIYKDVPEATVLCWADKLDGYCEALHEIFAGNYLFVGVVDGYIKTLKEMTCRYRGLELVITGEHPFLTMPKEIDFKEIIPSIKLHDKSSISAPTGIPQYDRWKELTLKHMGEAPLVQRKEYMLM